VTGADRGVYKTFRAGDVVRPRKVIRSPRYAGVGLTPADTGIVVSMGQRVSVNFAGRGPVPGLWELYDGDLELIGRRS
jgi:hypothetical protein